MSESYSIVLTGEINDGFTLEQVKANIGKLFKLDDDKVSALFVGKPVVIRRGLDKQKAIKMHSALSRSGAEVSIKKARPPAAEVKQTESQPEQKSEEKAAVISTPVGTLNCPRCGHEQPYSNACTYCKMNLKLHLQRLDRKEKMRIFRQQAS
jgi:hypothetical protein